MWPCASTLTLHHRSFPSPIRVYSCLFVVGPLTPRQRKIKRRPLVHLRLRPDPSSVPMYDPLNYRKPHSRSREFIRTVQSLKNSEKLVRLLHVKTHPVVLYKANRFFTLLFAAHFNERLRAG